MRLTRAASLLHLSSPSCLPHPGQVTDKRNSITKPRLNLRAAMGITLNCMPQISPTPIKAPNAGGTFTLTVTPPDASCAWSVNIPGVPWARVTGASSGTGPGSITVQIDPLQTSGQARSAGMVVSVADGSATTMLVSQATVSAEALSSDLRAPIMGRVQGSSSAGVVNLAWPTAQDNQSGISAYMVVYNQGNAAPKPRCTSGTPFTGMPTAQGGNLQLAVTGLTAGSTVTVRVCALDAAGNVAGGRIWRGSVKA